MLKHQDTKRQFWVSLEETKYQVFVAAIATDEASAMTLVIEWQVGGKTVSDTALAVKVSDDWVVRSVKPFPFFTPSDLHSILCQVVAKW